MSAANARASFRGILGASLPTSTSKRATLANPKNHIGGSGRCGRPRTGMKPRFVVLMVTFSVAVPLAEGVTDDGENEQVESVGNPEQLKDTAAEKPFSDVTVTEIAAVSPAPTAPCAGFIATEKSAGGGAWPVPDSVMLCGLVASLSLTCSVADS